jgi:hypothetical protein
MHMNGETGMNWKLGENGWATGTMAGGPFDGKTYGDLPILENGDVPSRIFIPTASAVEVQTYAVYDRQATSPEGTWLFVCAGDITGEPTGSASTPEVLPVGTSILYAPQVTPRQVEDDIAEEPSEPLQPHDSRFSPARRFVIAQSWWIASELCRRHPSRRVYEMHPGGGQSDVLRIWGPSGDNPQESKILCDLNRDGTIHVTEDERITWPAVFEAESPHEVVKAIEQSRGQSLHHRAPATTPTSLVYRVGARFLATRIDDRARWDLRMEFGDSSGAPGSSSRGFARRFPSALRAFERAGERMTAYDPGEHFWGVLSDDECVAVLDDAGLLHSPAGELTLMPIYRTRKRLDDVMAAVFDAIV